MSSRAPGAFDGAFEQVRRFPRDTTQLAHIRSFVNTWFAAHAVPATVIDDFELAVSELASNAMQHGSGSTVDIELTADAVMLTATVAGGSNDVAAIGSVGSWEIAPPDAISGRGLGIVAAIMDVVEFDGDEGRAVFRCGQRR